MRQGKIEPAYAPIDEEYLEIAGKVIGMFKEYVGKTYGALSEEIKDYEEIDYRLIRGLAQILERRCTLGQDAAMDPIAVRRAVFRECTELVTDAEERQRVLQRAAKKLFVTVDSLENDLWADYEENLVIKEFSPIESKELLFQYNLSLAQTLLFRAAGMEIWADGNYQEIFRKIKELGLLYSIEGGENSIDAEKIFIDGPASVFRMTERYGTSLAKLLPTVTKSHKWSIKAGIVKKTSDGKKILDFLMDYGAPFSPSAECAEKFDSEIEKKFAFANFGNWKVKREPAVLRAGQYAFIPDFSLELGSTRIYVEIVGFWTPEYLKKKIAKINSLNVRLILLVDKSLACSGKDFRAGDVIFYDKEIPVPAIRRILEKYEEKEMAGDVARLKGASIPLGGDVIDLAGVAREYKTGVDAVREVVRENAEAYGDYRLLGDQLVSRKTMNVIDAEISAAGTKKYADAVKILEIHGVKNPAQVLDALGYRIAWKGLDPANAEIVKISGDL